VCAGSMTRTANRWSLIESDPRAEEALVRELGVRPLVARLLANRGLREPTSAAGFLACSLSRSLRSLVLFGERRTAARRRLEALPRADRLRSSSEPRGSAARTGGPESRRQRRRLSVQRSQRRGGGVLPVDGYENAAPRDGWCNTRPPALSRPGRSRHRRRS